MITRTGWTVGRVLAVLVGGALALLGLAVVAVGTLATGAAMDGDRYTDLGESADFRSDGYAVTSEPWTSAYALPGASKIRITVTPTNPGGTGGAADRAVFAGLAPVADAREYLADVRHTELRAGYTERTQVAGSAPRTAPTEADVWVTHAQGRGAQSFELDPDDLDADGLTPVVMNADGSRAVSARWEITYRIPQLGGIAAGLLLGGAAVTAGGLVMVVRPIRRARSALTGAAR